MKKNIALVFGGKSSEHDVSLSSARSVAAVIDRARYVVIFVAILRSGQLIIGDEAEKYLEKAHDVDITERDDLVQFVQMAQNGDIDLVLPILHGAYGEDGRLQCFLDIVDVPYVFSEHCAHTIGMDKAKSKIVVAADGVPVVAGCVVRCDGLDAEDIVKKHGLPLVVKPNNAGSSIGISMVEDVSQLQTAVAAACEHSEKVIVEQKITGRELTVGVIERGGVVEVLPVIEIIPKTAAWYDYAAKYSDGGSEHVCPARIPHAIETAVKDYAQKAFRAIECKDLSRIDFLWDEQNDRVYFLEINTIPGMTGTSLVPDAARIAGMPFDALINGLIAQNIS